MRKHPTNQFDLLCSKCGNTNYIQRSTINYLLENKNELTYKEQKVYNLLHNSHEKEKQR